MSLDKAIKYKKENRKPYRGSKVFSSNCRHNICAYCRGNDLYNSKKRLESAKSKE